jgi:hypothetical protein
MILGPSVSKVVEFRNKCVKLRKPLFKTFGAVAGFETLFRQTMEKIGWTEHDRLNSLSNKTFNPDEPVTPKNADHNSQTGSLSLLEQPAIEFITSLLDRQAGWEATSAYEIARFRLISAGILREGNDEGQIGTHDANLLFIKREEFSFFNREKFSL